MSACREIFLEKGGLNLVRPEDEEAALTMADFNHDNTAPGNAVLHARSGGEDHRAAVVVFQNLDVRFFAEEAGFHFSEDPLRPDQVRFFAEEGSFFSE